MMLAKNGVRGQPRWINSASGPSCDNPLIAPPALGFDLPLARASRRMIRFNLLDNTQLQNVTTWEARSPGASISDCFRPYINLLLKTIFRAQSPATKLPWPCPTDDH